ncbi:MAG: hydrogenase maturation protease [Dehalococcoidales bacterium]|nr:hydrogenase maturation protease [Dehalococcoidales bacterium]
MTSDRITLILGLGNILLGDEGFGIHAARRLREFKLPGYIRVEEGGVGGFNLLGCLEGVERLIVIDAMMLDSPPGELLLWKPGPHFRETGKSIISFHQVGVMELVHMWGLLGCEPEILFLVTRPEKIEPGMELSPNLRTAAEQAARLVEKLCADNFADLERSVDLCIR